MKNKAKRLIGILSLVVLVFFYLIIAAFFFLFVFGIEISESLNITLSYGFLLSLLLAPLFYGVYFLLDRKQKR